MIPHKHPYSNADLVDTNHPTTLTPMALPVSPILPLTSFLSNGEFLMWIIYLCSLGHMLITKTNLLWCVPDCNATNSPQGHALQSKGNSGLFPTVFQRASYLPALLIKGGMESGVLWDAEGLLAELLFLWQIHHLCSTTNSLSTQTLFFGKAYIAPQK